MPQDTQERVKLNAFIRKVAGYYGLKGKEVTVEWHDDENKVDTAAVGGSGADAPVSSDRNRSEKGDQNSLVAQSGDEKQTGRV